MLIPLSWISEYTKVTMPFPKLATLMSEVGLTIEKWEEKDEDIVFDTEVTPNRSDWLSVIGTAREIAAATNEAFDYKEVVVPLKGKPTTLPITVRNNFQVCPRICTISISGVEVKASPDWLKKRIKQIGLRPINNLVDITNYVLWELGTPIHTFDYDKIVGAEMTVTLTRGGEKFRSLDGLDYTLPPDAIIISDAKRIIDLVPLKGGENTSITSETKNVLMHTIVVDPVITRKTSQALGLRSDASALSERGVDPNSLPKGLHRALSLILELAGGEVASEMIDTKDQEFEPMERRLSHDQLEKVIGVGFEEKTVLSIFKRLELPTRVKNGVYTVSVPTFRPDLQIEEDLIEEVARIYNYNNLPKTLPVGGVPTSKVAYARDFDREYATKQLLTALGYSETFTYSLIDDTKLEALGIDPTKTLRITNPISRDYEYLRPNLLGNLLDSIRANVANFAEVKLFELGKRYLGETLDSVTEEYWLWAGVTGSDFSKAKGEAERVLQSLGVSYKIRPARPSDNHYWFHPGRTAHIESQEGHYLGVIGEVAPTLLAEWKINGRVVGWGINYDLATKLGRKERVYQPVPRYPAITNDISFVTKPHTLVGEIIDLIKQSSPLVSSAELIDTHENTKTLRITYQDKTKNLAEKDVAVVRTKIIANLTKELAITPKDV